MAKFAMPVLKNPFHKNWFSGSNITAVSSLMLIVLFVCEIWVIKDAVFLAINLKNQPAGVASSKGVRVDFADYEAAVKRIQNAKSFQVAGRVAKNPFGTK